MLMSPETHAAYESIVGALTVFDRLRVRTLYQLFPCEPKKLLSARLRQMEALGYLVREDVPINGHGGALYRLAATSLPVFDSDAHRLVYERACSMYVLLASYGDRGRTAPELHRACDEGARLSVTASRLSAWERAGKVRCDRAVRPHQWFALQPTLQTFDRMVAAEALRRRLQGRPVTEAMKVAMLAAERKRAQREKAALDRQAAKMPIAPWLAPLVPKRFNPTSYWAGR